MKTRARRAAWALAGGLVLLTADTALWWWLGNRIAGEFAAWQAAETAQGLRVTAGAPHHAGWPLQAVAVVPDVTVRAENGASWHSEQLRLRFEPWRPRVFTALPVGLQRLELGPGNGLAVQARLITVAMPLPPAPQAVTRVDLQDMVAQPDDGPAWQAERLSLQFNTMDGDLRAEGVVLPKRPASQPALPFGGVIESLQVHARLSAPLPAAAVWRTALASWQAAGGRLQLSGLRLNWGALRAQGNASLRLTPQLQIAGDGTVQLVGYGEAIGAMQRSGLLTHDAAQVAGAVFGLLAQPGPGTPPIVELPLHLSGGVLSAGPVPVLRVPDFLVN